MIPLYRRLTPAEQQAYPTGYVTDGKKVINRQGYPLRPAGPEPMTQEEEELEREWLTRLRHD